MSLHNITAAAEKVDWLHVYQLTDELARVFAGVNLAALHHIQECLDVPESPVRISLWVQQILRGTGPFLTIGTYVDDLREACEFPIDGEEMISLTGEPEC